MTEYRGFDEEERSFSMHVLCKMSIVSIIVIELCTSFTVVKLISP